MQSDHSPNFRLERKRRRVGTEDETGVIEILDSPQRHENPPFPWESLSKAPRFEVEEELGIVHAAALAHAAGRFDDLDAVLSGCLEELSASPAAMPKYHLASAAYLSKKLPAAFALPRSFSVLLRMLKPPSRSSQAGKQRPSLPALLAAAVLQRALQSEPEWPVELVQALIDDLFGPREWCEHEAAAEFVANLMTAFPAAECERLGQRSGSGSRLLLDAGGKISAAAAAAGFGLSPADSSSRRAKRDFAVEPRFGSQRDLASVRSAFFSHLQGFMQSNAARESPKLFGKILKLATGWAEGRALAAAQVEPMLNNPNSYRAGQQVLEALLDNLEASAEDERPAVRPLLLMSVKQHLSSTYLRTVQSLCAMREEYLDDAVRHFVTTEICDKGKGNSVAILSAVMRATRQQPPPAAGRGALPPGAFEAAVAASLKSAFGQPELCPRAREALKRLLKAMLPDISIEHLCGSLMEPWPIDPKQPRQNTEIWLGEVLASISTIKLVATTQAVAEGASAKPTGAPQVESLLGCCARLMPRELEWCRLVVNSVIPDLPSDRYLFVIRRLFFLQGERSAYFASNEPFGEAEAKALQMLQWDVPVLEETLTGVTAMGLSSQLPLAPLHALSVVEALLRRAAAQRLAGLASAEPVDVPPVAALGLAASIMRLAVEPVPARGASAAALAKGGLPDVAVPSSWWRALLSVLLLGALNLPTVGRAVWEQMPTARALFEVLMTRVGSSLQSSGPAPAWSSCEAQASVAAADKAAVEACSSALLSTGVSWEPPAEGLLLLDPGLPPRQPPKQVLGDLFKMGKAYNLGHHLRMSQDPPLFRQLLEAESLPSAWPWLRAVVLADTGSLEALPKQWMPDVLVRMQAEPPEDRLAGPPSPWQGAIDRVACAMREALRGAGPGTASEEEAAAIIGSLARGLADASTAVRRGTRQSLAAVLPKAAAGAPEAGGAPGPEAPGGSPEAREFAWLEAVPQLSSGRRLAEALLQPVTDAVAVESDAAAVAAFLRFLRCHGPPPPSRSSAAAAASRLLAGRPLTSRWLVRGQTGADRIALDCVAEGLAGLRLPSGGHGHSPPDVEDVLLLRSPSDGGGNRAVLRRSVRAAAALLPAISGEHMDEQGAAADIPARYEEVLGAIAGRDPQGGEWVLAEAADPATGSAVPLLNETDRLLLAASRDVRLAAAAACSLPQPALSALASRPGVPPAAAGQLRAVLGESDGPAAAAPTAEPPTRERSAQDDGPGPSLSRHHGQETGSKEPPAGAVPAEWATPADAEEAVRWAMGGGGEPHAPACYWRLRTALQAIRRGPRPPQGPLAEAFARAVGAASAAPSGRRCNLSLPLLRLAAPWCPEAEEALRRAASRADSAGGSAFAPASSRASGTGELRDLPLGQLRPALLGGMAQLLAPSLSVPSPVSLYGPRFFSGEALAEEIVKAILDRPEGDSGVDRGQAGVVDVMSMRRALLLEALMTLEPGAHPERAIHLTEDALFKESPPLPRVAAAAACHLLHRSAWQARASLVMRFLSPVASELREDPRADSGAATAALDILEAFVNHPDVGGRPCEEGSTDSPLARFLWYNIQRLVGLVLSEAAGSPQRAPRISLLVANVRNVCTDVEEVVSRLCEEASGPEGPWRSAAADALARLYLVFPAAVANTANALGPPLAKVFDEVRRSAAAVMQTQSSSLAGLVNRLCRCAANEGAAAALRELATHHPAVVVPHLPSFAARLHADAGTLSTPEGKAAAMCRLPLMLGVIEAVQPELRAQLSGTRDGSEAEGARCPAEATLAMTAESNLEVIRGLKGNLRGDPSVIAYVAQAADFLCDCMAAGGRMASVVGEQIDRASRRDGEEAPLEERMPVAFPTVQKLLLLLELVRGWRRGDAGDGWSMGSSLPRDAERHAEAAGQQLAEALSIESAAEDASSGGLLPVDHSMGRRPVPPVGELVKDIEAVGAKLPRLLQPMLPSLLKLTSCRDAAMRRKAYRLLQAAVAGSSQRDAAAWLGDALVRNLADPRPGVAESAGQAVGELLPLVPRHKHSLLQELLWKGSATNLSAWHDILQWQE